MNNRISHSQRGQSMILVAMLMVSMIGMLALVLDGANAFFERRLMQNAADAGALAGARELCVTGNATLAADKALEYAIDRNGAGAADATVASGIVTVTAVLSFPTWFGGIFGQPLITTGADAAAGCFAPGVGTGILPVAWACQPPEGITGTLTYCDIDYQDEPGDNLYIIMDSQTAGADIYCQNPPNSGTPTGTLDCDYDDDGLDDVLAGGDRSWLDLNGGGGGASDLSNWVNGGFAGDINYHTWFGGQTGVANSVFQTVGDRVGDYVIIPVFDMYCDQPDALPENSCPGLYHFGEDTTVASGGSSVLYFHVISFSLFHITCVDAPGVPGPACPGKQAALAADPAFPNNAKTIEGYFVRGFVPGIRGRPSDGVDAGAYSLYLMR